MSPRLVPARCGFNAPGALLIGYPAQRCAGYAGFEVASAEFDARPVTGKIAQAIFEAEGCDTAWGPGGFAGALAYATDPAAAVVFDVGPDRGEPLALNLGAADLYHLLRADLADLRAAIAALGDGADPGDLTAPFTSNL